MKFIIASVAFLALLSIPFFGKASLVGSTSQATLSVSPATGSYNPNDTFTVSVYMNTNGQNAVVSAAYLNYDRNSFQAVSIDTTGSVFTMAMEKTIDANTGIIKITSGMPTPGVKTASGLVAKINFKALYGTTPSADNLTFRFTAGDSTQSTVIKDDGLGTDILSGVYGGKYTVSGQANPSPVPIPTPTPTPNSDTTPPAKVTNLVSTSTETQILLTWTNPTDGDYQKTKILRKTVSYPSSLSDGTVIFDDNKNSFTDSNLLTGTAYYYSVFTYDASGNYSQASQTTIVTKGEKAVTPSSYPDLTLLKTPDSFKVYVVIDQKKKWISTPEVFETLGYEWTNITIVDQSALDSIPDFEDNLIRAIGDYKVYLVVNGIKRHIPNPEIFLDYGFSWDDVKNVSQTVIDKYGRGYLIRESRQGTIYYLSSGGIRKHIPTPEIFSSYNDKWEDVQVISNKEMESYPESNLVKLQGTNNVYLVQSDTKRLIPSAAIFNKNKYDWNRVMEINRAEFDWLKTGEDVR